MRRLLMLFPFLVASFIGLGLVVLILDVFFGLGSLALADIEA